MLNNGGLVVIDADINGRFYCLNLINCIHMIVTGTGAGGTTYGIQLAGGTNMGLRIREESSDIEVEYLELKDHDGAGMRVGTLLSESDPWLMENIYIHDCYLHDIDKEGMYLGIAIDQGTPANTMQSLEVEDCILDACGWGGIQVRNNLGAHVHDNDIQNCGSLIDINHSGGGLNIGTSGDTSVGGVWERNFIKNCERGVHLLRGDAGIVIQLNFIIQCGGTGGIKDPQGGIRLHTNGLGIIIAHNDVLQSADYGVETKSGDVGSSSVIRDNIIAESGGSNIDSSFSLIFNNLEKSLVSECGFVDAPNDDYNLLATSLARNYASDGTDAGALQYVPPPTPTPEAVGIVLVPTPSEIAPRWESKQLSAHLYKPTIGSYTPRGSLVLDNLSALWTSYRHTKKRVGGYWDATMTQRGALSEIEDWLFRIGYHFECYNPALERIWEGFVNRVTLSIGGITVERGPLLDVVNRGYLVYSTVDTTSDPPIMGVRATSGPEENTASQERYGIIEKYASAGGLNIDAVNDILAIYVTENTLPRTGKRWNNRNVALPTATIELLGYAHWLKLYAYSDTTTGTRTLPLKIQDILGGDPNGLFSTDYSKVDPDGVNAQTINRYDNDNKTAWAQIKSITAQGDGTTPWSFGIYNDRQAFYNIAPDEWEYSQALLDPAQRVFEFGGPEVAPWDVEPGKLMLATDFLIGKTPPAATPREDERTTFIEQVSFIYPTFIDLVGGQFNTLSQRLATMGLSGIG